MDNINSTQGPWKVYNDYTIQPANLSVIIATINSSNVKGPIAKLNAQLIAAAPDLLEALQSCLSDLKEWGMYLDSIPKAEAAIKKAIGSASGIGAASFSEERGKDTA